MRVKDINSLGMKCEYKDFANNGKLKSSYTQNIFTETGHIIKHLTIQKEEGKEPFVYISWQVEDDLFDTLEIALQKIKELYG